MTGSGYDGLNTLFERFPATEKCRAEIEEAFKTLYKSYKEGGKLLVCGNGGSASDSDHIVGELMKEFHGKRPLSEETIKGFEKTDPEGRLAKAIRGALPAISLDAHTALITAIANDVDPAMIYAQQVYGYGRKGDVLLGLSTSGNSENVIFAVRTASAMGLKSIVITGEAGGSISKTADISIRLPETDTYKVQELTLPVYHALCIALEEAFWDEKN